MIAVPDGPDTLRFSITRVPVAERARAVQSLYERKLFPVRLNPLPNKELQLNATWKSLPGLSLISGVAAGLRADALREPSGNDDLCLGISTGSRSMFEHR